MHYKLLYIIFILIHFFIILFASSINNDTYTIEEQIKDKMTHFKEFSTINDYIYFIYDLFCSIAESSARYNVYYLKIIAENNIYSQLLLKNDCFSTTTLKNANNRIYSIGPDRIDNFAKIIYDPTNGTFSTGDIIIKQKTPGD